MVEASAPVQALLFVLVCSQIGWLCRGTCAVGVGAGLRVCMVTGSMQRGVNVTA